MATSAQADTVYFDNSASPVVSGLFIAASVGQVVRFKTDTFAAADNLSFADLWVNQFNVTDGKLPILTIYQDSAGALGSALTAASFSQVLPNSYTLQPVQVNFAGDISLASNSYYWIGMGFAPGSTGSLAWSTSLQDDYTTLAFITGAGVNYVSTRNMPNVKLVGQSSSVPDSGTVLLYLSLSLAGLALYHRRQTCSEFVQSAG